MPAPPHPCFPVKHSTLKNVKKWSLVRVVHCTDRDSLCGFSFSTATVSSRIRKSRSPTFCAAAEGLLPGTDRPACSFPEILGLYRFSMPAPKPRHKIYQENVLGILLSLLKLAWFSNIVPSALITSPQQQEVLLLYFQTEVVDVFAMHVVKSGYSTIIVHSSVD